MIIKFRLRGTGELSRVEAARREHVPSPEVFDKLYLFDQLAPRVVLIFFGSMIALGILAKVGLIPANNVTPWVNLLLSSLLSISGLVQGKKG